MLLAALVLACATGSGELVLKEKARVSGRFVRLADLLRNPDARVADVWLGRAPEEGSIRTIEADEVLRELERRGFDRAAWSVVGAATLVERGEEPANEALLRAVAFEIKRGILDREGADPADVVVRVDRLTPEPPAGAELAAVRDGTAIFDGGFEARVVARITRLQERAFAAKDVPAGKTLDAGDLEFRRVADGGEAFDVLGATAALRLRKGAAIGPDDVKAKPVVRRGELLRLTAPGYEVDAKASEDGALGREIEVEIAASKSKVRARVSGPGRVEIR